MSSSECIYEIKADGTFKPIVRCKNCIHRGKPGECPFAKYEEVKNPHYTQSTTTDPYADYNRPWIVMAVDHVVDDFFCAKGE